MENIIEELKILVVDDNEDIRNSFIEGLVSHGFKRENVTGVESGEEAEEIVKKKPDLFDVAIVDHRLKANKMDGIETTECITQLSREVFPIIFTNVLSDTPKSQKAFKAKAYRAGAYRYLARSRTKDGKEADVLKVKDFIKEIVQLIHLRDRVRKYYEAQRNFPSLLTQLDVMVSLVDRALKVWYMNPANLKFQKMSEIPSSTCSMEFVGCPTPEACRGCIVQETLNDGKNHERMYLHSFVGLGGRLKWIYSWTQPMPDENGEPILLDDGKPIAVLESTQDLTESVRLRTMPLEERMGYIARALYERADGFDRVRIYKTAPGPLQLTLLAHAGYYPREIGPAVLEISDFPYIQISVDNYQKYYEGYFYDRTEGINDPICPGEKLTSIIHWPLMKGERLVGLISVNEVENGRPCTADGIDAIKDYAEEALKAFEHTEGAPEDREIEKNIFDVDSKLIRMSTPEEVLHTLIDEFYRLTDSDNVHIRYREADSARLLQIGKGEYLQKAPPEIPLSKRNIPWIHSIVTGQPVTNNNTTGDPVVKQFLKSLPVGAREALKDMGSYCIEPLFFQNRCIGSVTLIKNDIDHYDTKNIKLAHAMAERLAPVVRDYVANILRMIKDYAFASSNDAIAVTDLEDKIRYVNKSLLHMWGDIPEKNILGKSLSDLWEDKSEADMALAQLHDGVGWIGELKAVKFDKRRTVFDAQLSASPVKDNYQNIIAIMASFMDISERKQMEKLQASIYMISEEASSAQNLNQLYQRIHQIVRDLMPADNFYISLYDEKSDTVEFPFFIDEMDSPPPAMKAGQTMTAYVLRTGHPILVSNVECEKLERKGKIGRFGTPSLYWLGVPLKTTENRIIGVLAVQVYKKGQKYNNEDKDMLEYVSTQIAMAIERKREEGKKAVMLQEIHHRVKNNFHFINSLLDLQSRQIKDHNVKEQFQFTQDRIRLMAMVHEKLYQSENLTEIDFKKYVSGLVDALRRSHNIGKEKISLSMDIKNISMGIDKAIPCGLILNELITNSLKYAFPPEWKQSGNSKEEVLIALLPQEDNTLILQVKDNGVGLPEDIKFFEAPSLGLRLVRLLGKQIHGDIKLGSPPGVDVSIRFKI